METAVITGVLKELFINSPIITLLCLFAYAVFNQRVQEKKISEVKNTTFKERRENLEQKRTLVRLASYETAIYKERKFEIRERADNEINKTIEGAFDVLRLEVSDKFRDALYRKKDEWYCNIVNDLCPKRDSVAEANLKGYTGELLKAFKEGEKIAKGFVKFNGFMDLHSQKLEEYCIQKNREINKKIWNALIPTLPKDLIEGYDRSRATEDYTLKTFKEIIYNVISIKKSEECDIEKERSRKEKALEQIYVVDTSSLIPEKKNSDIRD